MACGKSTFSKRCGWVMGENRPTAMRAAGWRTLIFAGASSASCQKLCRSPRLCTSITQKRLAPAGFRRRRTVSRLSDGSPVMSGSAYKAAGQDVRARRCSNAFSLMHRLGPTARRFGWRTRSRSPNLSSQTQKPAVAFLKKPPEISGLYARRHEAEPFKLKCTETNLARVDERDEPTGQPSLRS